MSTEVVTRVANLQFDNMTLRQRNTFFMWFIDQSISLNDNVGQRKQLLL